MSIENERRRRTALARVVAALVALQLLCFVMSLLLARQGEYRSACVTGGVMLGILAAMIGAAHRLRRDR